MFPLFFPSQSCLLLATRLPFSFVYCLVDMVSAPTCHLTLLILFHVCDELFRKIPVDHWNPDSPNDGLGLEVDAGEGEDLVDQPVVPAHLLLLLRHSANKGIGYRNGLCSDLKAVFQIRIRIRIRIHRIHVFWASRIRILLSLSKNSKKNLELYSFVTSFWLFIFEKWCKSTFKKYYAEKLFFFIRFCWHLEGQWWK